MAVTRFTQEIKVRAPAQRMFKALVTDDHVIPKLLPNIVKSIDIPKGDGGVGSVREMTFANGSSVKHVIEDLDIANLVVKYTLIEGRPLGDKIEKVYYERKFEDTSDGGCLIKIVGEYHTKGDFQIEEEEIKAGKDESQANATFLGEVLLAHPDVCA